MRNIVKGGLVQTIALLLALGSASAAGAQVTPAKPAPKPASTTASTVKPVTPKPAPVKPAVAAATVAPVDINHATQAQLVAVPGIGDAYAAKIIAGRPYANKSQLVSKKVLTSAVYKKVQSHLIAKQ